MMLARDLNYFKEKEAECELKECYLKRINGMSHIETLELAELCNVNIFPFSQKIIPVEGKSNYALKILCMQRLPLIAFEEAKKRNEFPSSILKCLFEEVDSIDLYECRQICVQYPFGKPVPLKKNFNKFIMHVTNKWKDFEIPIYNHLAKTLSVETDIVGILDYEDFQCLTSSYSCEDQEKIKSIQTEMQALELKRKKESCFIKDVKVREDDDSSNDEKISCDSSFDKTSDDESLYVISAKDTSIREVKGVEIEQTNEKVTVGIKCVDVKLSETTPLLSQDISINDEAKLDFLNFAPNSLTSNDLKVGLSFGELNPAITKCETDVTQKEAEDNSSIQVNDNDLYARNRPIKISEELVNNDTKFENIFRKDFNGSESKMRVCVGSYVFHLLQKHYIKKYPGSRCGLLFNKFSLQWKAHKIVIEWLNGKEGNNHPYDFELSKDGEIKHFVRVELTEVKDNDSFIISHKNMTMQLSKLPEGDKKCYIFHVLKETSSVIDEKNYNLAAVYKLIAMQ